MGGAQKDTDGGAQKKVRAGKSVGLVIRVHGSWLAKLQFEPPTVIPFRVLEYSQSLPEVHTV